MNFLNVSFLIAAVGSKKVAAEFDDIQEDTMLGKRIASSVVMSTELEFGF